ncbi:hypothetical protein [Dactylosporangium darangshiense]|uniref:Uncharacterized protein n=1 Tax=Dactylosporangium darangshiense TaxID=579108 RepID=A0ABP8DMH2_9ACTN
MSAQLHTMVFEWTDERGKSGTDVTYSSMSRQDDRLWYERLLTRVFLPNGHHDTGSTCYLHYDDGQAALLHRWPVKDGKNRDSARTRVLIGPPDVLTFDAAIALRTDEEPGDYGAGPFRDVPQQLISASDDESALLAEARKHEAQAVRLVAAMLHAGGVDRRFTIVAADASPRVLLWAVHACFAKETAQPWTFSTAEAGDTDGDLPRFVFVPARSARNSPGARDRAQIDLSRPDLVDSRYRTDAQMRLDAVFEPGEGRPSSGPPARAPMRPSQTATKVAETVAAIPVVTVPAAPPVVPAPPQALPPSAPPVGHPPLTTVVPPRPPLVQPVPVPAGRGVPEPVSERAEYPLLVFGMAVVSFVFVLFLMWAGSW